MRPDPVAPACIRLWTACVDIGPSQELGAGPVGQRFIVPILGGYFQGAEGYEALAGIIVPGGADRQVLRSDGVKELDAIYEMRTHSGDVLNIRNRVIVDNDWLEGRYAMSHLCVTAPCGPWDWLNRKRLIGTMDSLRPEKSAVLIHAWMLTPS
ncbi:DUF3237 domain-containing protein [Roseinatronobacter sp. S2]|uniref:DUF3237 domain-containing protein n=1 Tax=Roseinatronobacter sp. S2 TaxID=3035471 RepID=UPI00240F337B|nr:DUF3237 domain-containing protein [Roseinatronobacter sp. S2]WFE76707.1 DUF3237 domain-containing protein [Roseinatronobacter sp. S2]